MIPFGATVNGSPGCRARSTSARRAIAEVNTSGSMFGWVSGTGGVFGSQAMGTGGGAELVR